MNRRGWLWRFRRPGASAFGVQLLLVAASVLLLAGCGHRPDPVADNDNRHANENRHAGATDGEGDDADRAVSIATVDWPPYYAHDLPNGGPMTEVTVEALRLRGYTADVEFMPWARAQAEVRAGRVDVLLGAYRTSEREAYMVFSDGVIGHTESGLFQFADPPPITATGLPELAGQRVGVLLGTSISDEFDSADYLEKHETTSEENVLRLLQNERVELVAGDRLVFEHLLRRMGETRSLRLVLLLATGRLRNGFSRRDPRHARLRREFDLGLAGLMDSGHYAEILERHHLTRSARPTDD